MTIRPERMVIMNFSELKQQVSPADPIKPLPGVKQLQKSNANIVANYNAKSENSITVYDNGYVLFRSGKDYTVFRLHDCGDFRDREDPYGYVIPEESFKETYWTIRLIMEGEQRITYNKDQKEHSHTVSYSGIAEDWAYLSDIKYDGAYILTEQEEYLELIHTLQKQLAVLTDRQLFIFCEVYGHDKTHKEVAEEIGISRQAVTDSLAQSLKKLRKNLK